MTKDPKEDPGGVRKVQLSKKTVISSTSLQTTQTPSLGQTISKVPLELQNHYLTKYGFLDLRVFSSSIELLSTLRLFTKKNLNQIGAQ
jgi:hypothetical protein